jgi:hypothetical protein
MSVQMPGCALVSVSRCICTGKAIGCISVAIEVFVFWVFEQKFPCTLPQSNKLYSTFDWGQSSFGQKQDNVFIDCHVAEWLPDREIKSHPISMHPNNVYFAVEAIQVCLLTREMKYFHRSDNPSADNRPCCLAALTTPSIFPFSTFFSHGRPCTSCARAIKKIGIKTVSKEETLK